MSGRFRTRYLKFLVSRNFSTYLSKLDMLVDFLDKSVNNSIQAIMYKYEKLAKNFWIFIGHTLHIIATIFHMPVPHQTMPPQYCAYLENVTKKAGPQCRMLLTVSIRKLIANHILSQIQSTFPSVLNSSWKTLGFYSNVGFGADI